MRFIISRRLLLLIISITFAVIASAQTCTGSLGDPVINETFGQGAFATSIGRPLPAGVTTLEYSSSPCGEAGNQYGFVTYMIGCHAYTWHHLNHDHTGDENGYFMLINANDGPGVFYNEIVDGNKLCPNTTYEFAAWIMNVLALTDSTTNFVLPNLTFSIQTKSGKVLQTYNTGDLPETVNPEWHQYGTFFTTPSDGEDIVVKLINNAVGDEGNDFALDDITFRACGPTVAAGFDIPTNSVSKEICAGDNESYLLKATQMGYNSPLYQWQQNLGDGNGWADIPGATDTVYNLVFNNPNAGIHQYRIGVFSGNSTALACRIYSLPLEIDVNPFPVLKLSANTGVCVCQPLQLSIDQGDTYEWTGPNGFSSNQQNAIVTATAVEADNGTYTVKVTTGGCPTFAATVVKVYPHLVGVVSNNVTVCEGDATTLSAAQSQGATTYKWKPASGLSDTVGVTVNASPAITTMYTVTIGNGGCPDITQVVKVTVVKKPVANAGPTQKMTQGESVKLSGTVTGDSVSYYWTPTDYLDNPHSLTPKASPTDNITYTLHALGGNYCKEDTNNVFVRVFKKITIPNTFTPNNDGTNDFWDIKQLDTYPESAVSVFNRYGQKVYQSTGYAKPWDGKFCGSPLPQGTYYYIIDLKNDEPKIAGWVLIVR